MTVVDHKAAETYARDADGEAMFNGTGLQNMARAYLELRKGAVGLLQAVKDYAMATSSNGYEECYICRRLSEIPGEGKLVHADDCPIKGMNDAGLA